MIRVIAALSLLWGLLPNPYGFYMLLRVIVCAACAHTAYHSAQVRPGSSAWLFGTIAVLYNPLLPVYLTRTIWAPIDVATVGLLIWSLVRDRRATSPEHSDPPPSLSALLEKKARERAE